MDLWNSALVIRLILNSMDFELNGVTTIMSNSQQKWLDYQTSCVMRDQNHCPQPASPREILLQPMALGKVGTINLAESCECVSKHILLAIQTHTPPCAKLHACKYVPSSRAQIEGFLDHPRDSWMALNVGEN
jgi:hypothetical protein